LKATAVVVKEKGERHAESHAKKGLFKQVQKNAFVGEISLDPNPSIAVGGEKKKRLTRPFR